MAAKAKPRRQQEFSGLFRLQASKDEIRDDIVRIVADLQTLVEGVALKPGGYKDVVKYEPDLALAEAIRAEVQGKCQRLRKRKRLAGVVALRRSPRHESRRPPSRHGSE
eukprot:evm.model.scf_1281EXC.2 EVM.evm.TU.scf_1281EXC.2   scf_1281EXC:3077-3943(+)